MTTFLVATMISMILATLLSKKSPMPIDQGKSISTMPRMLVAFIPLLAISVFRWNVLPDTCYPYGSYYSIFVNYRYSNSNPFKTEILFNWLFKAMSNMKIPWFWVLALFSTFTVITFAWFIQKHSCAPAFSILLYTLFGLLLFPMGLLRQGVAEAYILIAYDALLDTSIDRKKKFIKVGIFLLLGILNHISTVLVAGAILIACWLLGKKFSFMKMTIISISAILASPFLMGIFIRIMSTTRFRLPNDFSLGETSPSLLLLSVFCILSILPVQRQVKLLSQEHQLCIGILFVFMVIMAYSSAWKDPFRIIHMFTPIILVTAPLIRKLYPTKTFRALYTCAYVIVAGLLFWRTMDGSNVTYQSIFSYY